MDKKMITRLKCPKCGTEVKVEMTFTKFFLYKCSDCKSNVVLYNNRTDIISDEMVSKIKKDKIFNFPKKVIPTILKKEKDTVNEFSLVDLKILLETTKDINDFLDQI